MRFNALGSGFISKKNPIENGNWIKPLGRLNLCTGEMGFSENLTKFKFKLPIVRIFCQKRV